MAHYEPPHQDLRCLQIQLFLSLVVKELNCSVKDSLYSGILLSVLIYLAAKEVLVAFTLTLKAPITTAADDIHKFFFMVFQRK